MSSKRYIRNVIKSFSQAVPDAIGDELPGAKGLLDLAKSTGAVNLKGEISGILGAYKDDIGTVKKLFKGIKKAVKTGKFYDREEEASAGLGGDEDLFGDSDTDIDSAFGDSFDEGDSEDGGSVEGTETKVAFVKDDGGSQVIAGTVAAGAAKTTSAIERGSALSYTVLNDIDQRLVRMEEASNTYYRSSLELLSSLKENVESLVKVKAAAETDLSNGTIERLFGDGNQEFSLQLYMRHLNKKMDSGSGLDSLRMMGMMMTPGTLAKIGIGAALSKLPVWGVVTRMSDMMKGMGQLMLNNMANVKGNGPLAKIMRMFGVKTTAERNIDLSKFVKGPIPFDGVTKKAIVDVIPTLLAKIHNVIKNGRKASDDTMEMFDQDKGHFRTIGKVREELKRGETRDFGDLGELAEMYVQASGLQGQEAAKTRSAINDYISSYIKAGGNFSDLAGKKGTIAEGIHKIVKKMSASQFLGLQKNALDFASSQQASHLSASELSMLTATQGDSDKLLTKTDYYRKENIDELKKVLGKIPPKLNSKGKAIPETDGHSIIKRLEEAYTAHEASQRGKVFKTTFDFKEWLKTDNIKIVSKEIEDALDMAEATTFGAHAPWLQSLKSEDIDTSAFDMFGMDEMNDSQKKFLNKAAGFMTDLPQNAASGFDDRFIPFAKNKGKEFSQNAKGFFKSAKEKFSRKGFAKGGFTGFGPKDRPAGIVHKGEYVVPQDILGTFKGGKLVNELENLRGYANGGEVVGDGRSRTLSRNLDVSLKNFDKAYRKAKKLGLSPDSALQLALIAQDNYSLFETELKIIRAAREVSNPKKNQGFGADVKQMLKDDIIDPLAQTFGGLKANFKDGKLDVKSVLRSASKHLPGIATGAGIGFAASFFLPGGPLLGALAGGAIGELKQNKALRGLMFGEDAGNGRRKYGIFTKLTGALTKTLFGREAGEKAESSMDSFFKNPFKTLADTWKDPRGRKTMLGAGAGGLLGSFFGPGGTLLGALAGGAIGHKKQQGFFSRFMFGKKVVDADGNVRGYTGGLYQSMAGAFNLMVAGPAQTLLIGGSVKDLLSGDPKKIHNNFKKGMFRLARNAGVGGLLGSFFGPFGTFAGALLGTASGIRPIRAASRYLLFGRKGDKLLHGGGLIGGGFEIMKKVMGFIPFLATGMAHKIPYIGKFFKVLGLPFKLLAAPFKLLHKVQNATIGNFFRKWYGGSKTVLTGMELIQAINADPSATTGDRLLAGINGTLTAGVSTPLREISDNLKDLFKKRKKKEDEAEASDDNVPGATTSLKDINTAEEIKEESEKEKKEEFATKAAEGMLSSSSRTAESTEEVAKSGNKVLGFLTGPLLLVLGKIAGAVLSGSALDALRGIIPGGKGPKGGKAPKGKRGGRFKGKAGAALFGASLIAPMLLNGAGEEDSFQGYTELDEDGEEQMSIAGSNKAGRSTYDGKLNTIQSIAEIGATTSMSSLFDKTGEAKKKRLLRKTKTTSSLFKSGGIKGRISSLLAKIKEPIVKLFGKAKTIAKKIPRLGAVLSMATVLISAYKNYNDKGGATPRERFLNFLKESVSLISGIIMYAIANAILPGVGTLIMMGIDVLSSVIGLDSLSDIAAKYIVRVAGGAIADLFGFTLQRDAAWVKACQTQNASDKEAAASFSDDIGSKFIPGADQKEASSASEVQEGYSIEASTLKQEQERLAKELGKGSFYRDNADKTRTYLGTGITGSQAKLVGVSLNGLNPEFKKRFLMATEEYQKLHGGGPVKINAGFRSNATQRKMYEQGQGEGAAKPGLSMHEYGVALDANWEQMRQMDNLGILAKYGLKQTDKRPQFSRKYANSKGDKALMEEWHVSMAELATPAARAAYRAKKKDFNPIATASSGGALASTPTAPKPVISQNTSVETQAKSSVASNEQLEEQQLKKASAETARAVQASSTKERKSSTVAIENGGKPDQEMRDILVQQAVATKSVADSSKLMSAMLSERKKDESYGDKCMTNLGVSCTEAWSNPAFVTAQATMIVMREEMASTKNRLGW